MSIILGIDPGSKKSAVVVYDAKKKAVLYSVHAENPSVKLRLPQLIDDFKVTKIAIEKIGSYGFRVGASIFDTILWTGRFIEYMLQCPIVHNDFGRPHIHPVPSIYRVSRKSVVAYICGSARANDTAVRASLLDRFGGKVPAIGSKAEPGPLFGLKVDERSALAVAIYAAEKPTGLERIAA